MMRLNHAHLSVPDVGALRDFLVRHFDFTTLATRGADGFAVLRGADGFVLALLRAKAGTAPDPHLHVGFFVDSSARVHAKHAELRAAGIDAGEVERVTRSGFTSLTFYCQAPGGLLVEVAHQE